MTDDIFGNEKVFTHDDVVAGELGLSVFLM